MGLEHIRRTYEAWGSDDPFYAVLTAHDKKGGGWDPEAFFARGRQEVDGAMADLEELGLAPPEDGRALDFGCGVGRLSQALARHVGRVVGVDISSSMVERARSLNRHGDTVRYEVNTEPHLERFDDGSFDLVYSSITLQHIPPRFVRRYLAEFVRVLRPGGVALFQMRNGPRIEPGSLRHLLYRLNREPFRRFLQRLRGRPPYEIHFMARSQVEECLEAAGATVVDVVDVSDGRGKSFRYCAVAEEEDGPGASGPKGSASVG